MCLPSLHLPFFQPSLPHPAPTPTPTMCRTRYLPVVTSLPFTILPLVLSTYTVRRAHVPTHPLSCVFVLCLLRHQCGLALSGAPELTLVWLCALFLHTPLHSLFLV